jgi:ABC-2 type transport system ATP-binding protein
MSTNTPDGPAIELAGLSKRFGRTVVLDHLYLQIPHGSTFGLLGPNGAGKTTTIKILMGVLAPTAGAARVLGMDSLAQRLRIGQVVGYVPEIHHMYRWMRVEEVIGFCRSIYRSWNDQTCKEMLDLFALPPRKKVKHLSKGMLVKLSLLLAVSHEPEVLVLDEPLAGLDPIAREEFLDGVLRTICERGRTVLLSTHTLDDVRRLADTVGILCNGQLLLCGNIDNLLTTTKRLRATLRDGCRPQSVPPGTIYQRVQGREWLLTVRDFAPEKVEQVRATGGVEHVEVLDVGLEDLFKDFVKGQRGPK